MSWLKVRVIKPKRSYRLNQGPGSDHMNLADEFFWCLLEPEQWLSLSTTQWFTTESQIELYYELFKCDYNMYIQWWSDSGCEMHEQDAWNLRVREDLSSCWGASETGDAAAESALLEAAVSSSHFARTISLTSSLL